MVGGKAGNSVEQKTNGKDGAEWLKHGLPHASSLIPLQGVRWADVLAQRDVGCCCAVVRQLLSFLNGSSSLSEMVSSSLKKIISRSIGVICSLGLPASDYKG